MFLAPSDWWSSKLCKKTKYVYKQEINYFHSSSSRKPKKISYLLELRLTRQELEGHFSYLECFVSQLVDMKTHHFQHLHWTLTSHLCKRLTILSNICVNPLKKQREIFRPFPNIVNCHFITTAASLNLIFREQKLPETLSAQLY